jgi:hypothetical protein
VRRGDFVCRVVHFGVRGGIGVAAGAATADLLTGDFGAARLYAAHDVALD